MSRHARRIEKLERKRQGNGVIWVIDGGPDGMSTDEAIKLVGATPGPIDLVVFLRNFGQSPEPPHLISKTQMVS